MSSIPTNFWILREILFSCFQQWSKVLSWISNTPLFSLSFFRLSWPISNPASDSSTCKELDLDFVLKLILTVGITKIDKHIISKMRSEKKFKHGWYNHVVDSINKIWICNTHLVVRVHLFGSSCLCLIMAYILLLYQPQ